MRAGAQPGIPYRVAAWGPPAGGPVQSGGVGAAGGPVQTGGVGAAGGPVQSGGSWGSCAEWGQPGGPVQRGGGGGGGMQLVAVQSGGVGMGAAGDPVLLCSRPAELLSWGSMLWGEGLEANDDVIVFTLTIVGRCVPLTCFPFC